LKITVKRLVIIFVLGAVLGPVGDLFHLLSGTTAYPDGFPFWAPLLFGAAGLGVGLSHPMADRVLGPSSSRLRPGVRCWTYTGLGLAAFLGLYCASGYLPGKTGGLRDLLLAGGAIGVWVALDRTWQGLLLAAATALCGTLFEIGLVSTGAFYYLPGSSNFYGVASWLPWLYVAASVAMGNLGRKVFVPQVEAPQLVKD